MADTGALFNLSFKNHILNAELDENNQLSEFEFSNRMLHTRFSKKHSKKMQSRSKFYITGIPQLSTVSPYPLDREDLVEKEHSGKPLTQQSWFSVMITLLAVGFDFICYLYLFDQTGDGNSGLNTILISIAAAFAIDVLPAFFARILHSITAKQKVVLWSFFILSTIYIVIFIVVCFLTRLGVIATFLEKYIGASIDPTIFAQSLIPISTTLVSFIVNYLSTNPYEKEVEKLKKLKLYRQENINELRAVIRELESDSNYSHRLTEEDRQYYECIEKSIDAISKHYQTAIRIILMAEQSSPADTSDLAARFGYKNRS